MNGALSIAVAFRQISIFLLAFTGCWVVSGADLVVSNLPPPAKIQIDFARDIKPILEANCLRCHGLEKPKSHFRLDNLADALRGGDNNTNDIIPGDGAKSPLIHYVAYRVEDMEMPPVGKGSRLSSNDVSLLRAWIDEGVNWDTGLLTNNFDFSFTPVIGVNEVSGNKSEFREQNWQPDGVNGGVEDFQLYQQTGPDTTLLVNGHVLPDDYSLSAALDRPDLGFIPWRLAAVSQILRRYRRL